MKDKIAELLKKAVREIDTAHEVSPGLISALKVDINKDRSRGDLSCSIAMPLSKALHRNPRQVAEELCAKLAGLEGIARIEIAGPGFLNFFLDHDYTVRALERMCDDPRLGVELCAAPKITVVDYSAPNVAKEMAVHHLRSTVIGDALVRVLEFLGHQVIRANHIGDWGTQFGMLIAYLEEVENSSGQGMDLSDFEAFYRQAKERYDSDEDFAVRARRYVVQLQGGDEYCLRMWRKLVNLTMTQNQALYHRLDVTLSEGDIMGESLYNEMLPGIVEDLIARGIAVEDHGAIVVYLPQFKNKEGQVLGNIVRKQDGGYLYTTTDIACIKYRVDKLKAQRIIYVVDSRQHQHLLTVWEIARKAGYAPEEVVLEHCPFGMMLGKDGRPFKTRSGGTVKLRELLDEAEERVSRLLSERGSNFEGAQRQEVVHNIAIGAVKYADLSKNRNTDYVFDWDLMLSFEGNTAPYLQYAYSRIRSIFRKAATTPGVITLTDKAEEELAAKLLSFPATVTAVGSKCQPHLLCTYLYELSEVFMSFYESCPVIKEGVPLSVQQSRLKLCELTSAVLRQGLDLLGIKVMEMM